MAELLRVWRPRAFALAGRAGELSREEALRGRHGAAARRRRAAHARAPRRPVTTTRPSGCTRATSSSARCTRAGWRPDGARRRADRARRRLRSRARACSLRASPCSRSSPAAPTPRCSPTPCTRSAIRSRRCTSRTGCAAPRASATPTACRALAAGLGIPHREVDGPWRPGPGIEARAREQRRAAADALRAGRAVATGHTRDDRVETILYRLAASPGAAAFAALPAADGDGRVRPLLELGRDEVRARSARAGIPWRDDRSNEDRPTRATACAWICCRRSARCTRPPRPTCCAPPSCSPRTTPRSTRIAAGCSRTATALATAAVAAAPPRGRAAGAAARRGLPGAAPGRCRARRRARALALRRRLVPLGARPLRRAPLRPHRDRRAGAPPAARCARVALAVPARRPTATRVVHCALGDGGRCARRRARGPRSMLRPARAGERLPGARRTIARMLLEARVPRSERARYPVVAVHGEPVALPGIAVAPALRRPSGLVLTITSC